MERQLQVCQEMVRFGEFGRFNTTNMKRILFAVILLIPFFCFPTTYYVSNLGSDSNNGTSEATSWKTKTKVSGFNLQKGDVVKFKRGDSWIDNTALYVNGGTEGNPITYTSYGSGNKPIIHNQDSISGWTGSGNWTQSGNAWYIANTTQTKRLFVDEIEFKRSESLPVSTSNKYYVSSTRLYIYSATNPATTFTSINYPSGYSGLSQAESYFVLKNIDFRGGMQCLRLRGVNNSVIDSCSVGMYCGGNGIGVSTYPAVVEYSNNNSVSNCTFDTGGTGFWGFESAYTGDAIQLSFGSNNWVMHHNTFTNWGHNALGILNGVAGYTCSNNKFYNNYVTCEGIDYGRAFGYNSILVTESGNEIYNNVFYSLGSLNEINGANLKMYYNITNIVRTPVYRLTTAQGLNFDGYSNGKSVGCEIYNNVFAYAEDIGIMMSATGTRRQNNIIKNNIIFECDLVHDYAIRVANNDSNMNNTWQNNLIYKEGKTNLVNYKDVLYTASGFNAINGVDGCVISGNIQANPMFVNPTAGNFRLQTASPAIAAGLNVGLTSDIEGSTIVGSPTIGVYNYIINPSGFNKARILPNGKVPINSRNGYRGMVKK